MGRPVSASEREAAILLLDVCASNAIDIFNAARALDIRFYSTGYRLAHEAYTAASFKALPDEEVDVCYAEAAGLLRDGWDIGDDVVSVRAEPPDMFCDPTGPVVELASQADYLPAEASADEIARRIEDEAESQDALDHADSFDFTDAEEKAE